MVTFLSPWRCLDHLPKSTQAQVDTSWKLCLPATASAEDLRTLVTTCVRLDEVTVARKLGCDFYGLATQPTNEHSFIFSIIFGRGYTSDVKLS